MMRQLEPSPVVRLKASEKITTGGPPSGGPASGGPASGGPASGGPASGGPASGGPASGGPASGGPASGGPASGIPPSLPPPEVPLTVKLRKMTPATSVHIPAVPEPASADAEVSFTMIFAVPFTDATSRTGLAPVADTEMVAQLLRSAIRLGACPSTVIDVPLCRL